VAEKIEIKEILEETGVSKKKKSYVLYKIKDINDKEYSALKTDDNKELKVGDFALIKKVKVGRFWNTNIYPETEEFLKLLEPTKTPLALDIEKIKIDIAEILSILKK
jgi:hypothetical protein